MTPVTVRRLTENDLPAALPLLLDAARHRARLEPPLWPLHPEAETRTRAALERDLAYPQVIAWFLAEQQGEVVGIVKSGRYPAPPVYADLLAGQTGLELHTMNPQALSALLDASETFQAEGEVALNTAVCAAQDTEKLTFLQGRGYQALTNWMIRPLDAQAEMPDSVRHATPDDIPAIVELNATAQELKRRANSHFWTPHLEARTRFERWMGHALTLTDRDMLVREKDGLVRGFVIVQPTPHHPAANDATHTATLDDLAAHDWDTFQVLVQAAQHTAHQRGLTTLQVISPVNWPERNEALQDAGFRTANLWMLREPSA